MATFQSNDFFPEGGNYKAGDIVYSPAGAPVAAWIHTGRDFVPYHKAENKAIGGVTSTTDLTGMVTISGPSGSPIQMYLTQTQYNALVAAGQIVSTCLYITSGA